MENPASLLFFDHENNINSVRKSLLSNLKKRSLPIATGIENILNRKKDEAKNKNLPHLFELFPWLLKDLTGLDHEKTYEIAINWLSLYLYISLMDDYLDFEMEIKADEFIGSSFLAHNGLINLFKIVNETRYEKIFSDSLFSSAKYQLNDVLVKPISYGESFEKAESASGKNSVLVACAGAVAASCENNSEFVIDLTQELLLSIQLLDDLADFEEDLINNNITILLNGIFTHNRMELKNITRSEIIHQLIISKSLLNVITRIESSLSTSISLILSRAQSQINSTSTFIYITSLFDEVFMLRTFLEVYQNEFEYLTNEKQNIIIKEIDKRIHRIYLHT